MSKFKFSEKERKELDDLISNVLEYKGDMEYFIGEIESILSAPPEPAETGGAEEILMNCCIEAMPNRESEIRESFDKDRSDQEEDDMFFTKIIESFSRAMTTYAEKRCADKDREIERLKEFEFMYNGLNK